MLGELIPHDGEEVMSSFCGRSHLARNSIIVPLTVQQRHDNAKGCVQAGQGIAKGDVGAHRGAVSKAIQMPATLHNTGQGLERCHWSADGKVVSRG